MIHFIYLDLERERNNEPNVVQELDLQQNNEQNVLEELGEKQINKQQNVVQEIENVIAMDIDDGIL